MFEKTECKRGFHIPPFRSQASRKLLMFSGSQRSRDFFMFSARFTKVRGPPKNWSNPAGEVYSFWVATWTDVAPTPRYTDYIYIRGSNVACRQFSAPSRWSSGRLWLLGNIIHLFFHADGSQRVNLLTGNRESTRPTTDMGERLLRRIQKKKKVVQTVNGCLVSQGVWKLAWRFDSCMTWVQIVRACA